MTFTVNVSSLQLADVHAFGAAVYEATLGQLSAADESASSVRVSVRITEESQALVRSGSLDALRSTSTAVLVDSIQAAVCESLVGTCTVNVVDDEPTRAEVRARRQRRRELQSQLVSLIISRTYDHEHSTGASTPISNRIASGVAASGADATVDSIELLGLQAQTVVFVLGTIETSTADDALEASVSVLGEQLVRKLPNVGITISTPTISVPPSATPTSLTPPPPFLPSLGPPLQMAPQNGELTSSNTQDNSDASGMIAIGVAAVGVIFIISAAVVRYVRSRHTARVAPNNVRSMPNMVAARHTRIAVKEKESTTTAEKGARTRTAAAADETVEYSPTMNLQSRDEWVPTEELRPSAKVLGSLFDAGNGELTTTHFSHDAVTAVAEDPHNSAVAAAMRSGRSRTAITSDAEPSRAHGELAQPSGARGEASESLYGIRPLSSLLTEQDDVPEASAPTEQGVQTVELNQGDFRSFTLPLRRVPTLPPIGTLPPIRRAAWS